MNSSDKNYVVLDDGFVLYMVGVLVSNVKINWVYDGWWYKIEMCINGNFNVYKVYVYFR